MSQEQSYQSCITIEHVISELRQHLSDITTLKQELSPSLADSNQSACDDSTMELADVLDDHYDQISELLTDLEIRRFDTAETEVHAFVR